MFDPFDHSQCDHEPPEWIVKITDQVGFDLIQLLNLVWKCSLSGKPELVAHMLQIVGHIGTDLQFAVLGMPEKVDEYYLSGKSPLPLRKPAAPKTPTERHVDRTKALKDDLYLDKDTWIEDMKALFKKDQEGNK